MTNRPRLLCAIAAALLVAAACTPATAQRRGEYMTDDELDLVRDVRRIDHRAEVFLKVAARRIIALGDPKGDTGDTRSLKLGPLPTGSQIDLLDDYRRAIEELEVKFDDEFERTGMTDDLRAGLEIALPEIERQLKALDAIKPKLTESDSDHYLERALGAARELRDGAKKALDANPAPPKKK